MKKLAPWLCLFLALTPLLRSATPALSPVSITTSRVQFEAGDAITIREVLATSPTLGIGDTVLVRGDYTLRTRERARLQMFTTSSTVSSIPAVSRDVAAGAGSFELQYTITVVGLLRLTFYNAAPPGESFGSLFFEVTGSSTTPPTTTTPLPPTTSTAAPAGMVAVAFTTSRAQFATGDSITVREMFATSPRLEAGDTVVVRGDYTLRTTARVTLLMFANLGGTVPTARREIAAASGTFELQYVLPAAAALRLAFYHAEPPGDFLGGLYLEGITRASVSVPADAKGSLANLSIRSTVTADAPLLAGLAVTEQDRFVLIRAVGPTLSAFGVPGVLRKPVISLHRAGGELVQTVGSWSALPANQRTGIELVAQSVGGFPLNAGSDDAVLHVRLAPGTYTITISSGDGQSGAALLEVYTAGNYFLPASP
jgi:hypothetical protein